MPVLMRLLMGLEVQLGLEGGGWETALLLRTQ